MNDDDLRAEFADAPYVYDGPIPTLADAVPIPWDWNAWPLRCHYAVVLYVGRCSRRDCAIHGPGVTHIPERIDGI